MIEYQNLDSAFVAELQCTLENGDKVSPRGVETIERTGCTFRITDPRNRLIFNSARHWSAYYAIGEFFWHLAASDDLDFISYYSRKWKCFSDNQKTIGGSAYGARIFGTKADDSQWDFIKNILRSDPATRRAVLSLHDPADLNVSLHTKDTPCTCNLQFLIRNNSLCLIAFMRSNDIYLGFGYDIFLFTMLQEMMAIELNLTLGWYQHMVGSFHLYEKDRLSAMKVVHNKTDNAIPMSAMVQTDIPELLKIETQIRKGSGIDLKSTLLQPSYWRQLVTVLMLYKARSLNDFSGVNACSEILSKTCFSPLVDLSSSPERPTLAPNLQK